MGFNECECGSGIIHQWIFLGLSVKSFTANVNALKEGGSVSVVLIYDPQGSCDKPKKYLDSALQTQDTYDPDPGWLGNSIDLIGLPVMFKYEDFEFAGIVNGVKKDNSVSGELYTVDIISPYFLLEKVQLIIGDYTGATNNVSNLMNIYGLYEHNSCPTFGFSGNYGTGMPWNKVVAGIEILSSQIANTSSITTALYLQTNRIKLFPGNSSGYGLIPEDDTGYILDISEVPGGPSRYLIPGPNIGIVEALDQVAEDGGFEYFVDLVPCTYNSNIYKVIKVRVIDRTGPIAANSLQTFLDNYNSQCGYISKNIANELRSAPTSNFVVGSKKQQMYYAWRGTGTFTSYNEDFYDYNLKANASVPVVEEDLSNVTIKPYWGVDSSNNLITSKHIQWIVGTPCTGTGDWLWQNEKAVFQGDNCSSGCYAPKPKDTAVISTDCRKNIYTKYVVPSGGTLQFEANTEDLVDKLDLISVGGTITLNELELIAAQAGLDKWKEFATLTNTETYQYINAVSTASKHMLGTVAGHAGNLAKVLSLASQIGNVIKPFHKMNLRRLNNISADWDEVLESEIQTIYNFVKKYADEYYGLAFAVRLPFLCAVVDEDSGEVKYSREVIAGGWPEDNDVEFPYLLGIPNPSPFLDFFRSDDGTLQAFVRFDNAAELDSEGLTEEDYGYIKIDNGYLWVRCEVEQDFVFGDYANRTDPHVIIRLPDRMFYRPYDQLHINNINDPINNSVWAFWPSYAQNAGIWNSVVKNTPGFSSNDFIPKFYATPHAVTVPLLNHEEVYGPWFNSVGAGSTNYVIDDSLTPWNQGSMTDLNSLGQAIADFGVINMYKNQNGFLNLVGAPVGRLGEEILAFDGSGYNAGQRYVETRNGTLTISSGIFTGINTLKVNLVTTIFNGTLGPIVTAISISVGPDGITSSYSFDLYTKGYRRFAKNRIDQAKLGGELRRNLFAKFKNGIKK